MLFAKSLSASRDEPFIKRQYSFSTDTQPFRNCIIEITQGPQVSCKNEGTIKIFITVVKDFIYPFENPLLYDGGEICNQS